jgi:hypothetical protein
MPLGSNPHAGPVDRPRAKHVPTMDCRHVIKSTFWIVLLSDYTGEPRWRRRPMSSSRHGYGGLVRRTRPPDFVQEFGPKLPRPPT